MPTNDFKPFAVGGSASVISQATYTAAATLLANGFQTGIADKDYLNKVWRQSSIMAAVIGKLINDVTGDDAIDDGTIATITLGLIEAIQTLAAETAASGTIIPTTGGTTTLDATQYNSKFIEVTGALVSDATLVFPTQLGDWYVINNTTGAYSLFSKTAAGTPLEIAQAATEHIVCDDANILYAVVSAITQTPGNSSPALASTEFVTLGIAAAVAATGIKYVSANTQLVNHSFYLVNATAPGIILTLPLSPVIGDAVVFQDAGSTWGQNIPTLARNGQTIESIAEDLSLNLSDSIFTIWFNGSTWKLI